MMLSIINPVAATNIFIVIFLVALIISARLKPGNLGLSPRVSTELKGVAILAVIFSHIGYFLITDHRFLFPLSIMAGVGVNLFLFVSGFGLTASSIKNKFSLKEFYQRRLAKLFTPMWLVLIAILLLDFFILHRVYGFSYIGRSFLGFFPQADVFSDIDSPLWYFSLILFYYLVFPLFYFLKNYKLSALTIYAITYFIIKSEPKFLSDIIHLYKIHLMAFPFGMLIASLVYEKDKISNFIIAAINYISSFLKGLFRKISYYILSIILLAVAGYTAYYSNVGAGSWAEEITSLITMSAIIILFSMKKIKFGLFYIFGLYSYEIYLFHWPVLSRYDLFYKFTPAWLATALYLILFLVLAWALKNVAQSINKKL